MHLPVVASNVTGTRDVMREELQQWLYKPDDHERASDLILRLLEDPRLAHEVAAQGRRIMVRSFNTERMRESLITAYSSALRQAGKKMSISVLNSASPDVEFAGASHERREVYLPSDES